MINFIDKGHGLHAAIQSAGHWLMQSDGVWISDNDAAVQAIIDGYTLAQAAAVKSNDVDAYAKKLRDKVIASTSPGELSSWPIKLAEAKTYGASKNPADAPMLSAEAAARGITLDALVSRVDSNAQVFAALECQIAGNSGKHRDAIASLTDFASIAAYDFSTGWPAV